MDGKKRLDAFFLEDFDGFRIFDVSLEIGILILSRFFNGRIFGSGKVHPGMSERDNTEVFEAGSETERSFGSGVKNCSVLEGSGELAEKALSGNFHVVNDLL